ERSCMASVEGIEQCARLASAHFAENDPVGSEAKRVLQQLVERHVGLVSTSLGSDRNYVRLPDLKLGGVFDDEDAFILWNRVGQYPQERRLSGPRSTADEQRFAAAN